MKQINYTAILLLLIGCNTTHNSSAVYNKDILIVSKSKELWHSGAKEGYGGTNYSIKVIVNTNKLVRFDTIWTENKLARLKVFKDKELIGNKSINKGDTLSLKASILNIKADTLKVEPPLKLQPEQAAISYVIVNTLKYEIIQDFEIKKGPLRP